MAYTRTVRTPDTFGMMARSARSARDRASGRKAAEQGRHSGGPCPAVALATLTGRSYGWAFQYLNRETGYTGRGEFREPLDRAAAKLFGEPTRKTGAPGCTIAALERSLPPNAEGFAYCPGHVMPIRQGRILNASPKHRRFRCDGVTLFDIVEVRE